MRATSDEYWNTSLPKDHDALYELDEYCKEWGGLTRAEATRRLLIEWAMLRKGKDIAASHELRNEIKKGRSKQASGDKASVPTGLQHRNKSMSEKS